MLGKIMMNLWNGTLKLSHDSQTALPQKLNERYCDLPDSWNRKQRTISEQTGNNEARRDFREKLLASEKSSEGKKKRL